MAQLGGYMAVGYVAEHAVVDGVDAAWRVLWRDAVASSSWSTGTAVGTLAATGWMSVDKPSVQFQGAGNAVQVRLSGGCRLDLVLDGSDVGGALIGFDATVSLPIGVQQDNAWDVAVIDLTGFTLAIAQLRVSWYAGPHDARAESALLSEQARAALTAELRKRATPYLTFQLPTDRLWAAELAAMTQANPGSIVEIPFVKLGAARVLDGWLALGIDDTTLVQTAGDPSAIGLPPDPPPPGTGTPLPQADPGDGSLRLIIDPVIALRYLQVNAKLAITIAAAQHPNLHPDPNSITISFDNAIVLTADGTVDAPNPFPGSMPFTATVRITPFVPANTSTVYASVKPDVTVDAPWYIEVLGDIVDLFGGDAFGQLNRVNKTQMAILFGVKQVQNVDPPGDNSLTARIEGRQLVTRDDLVGFFGEGAVISYWTDYSAPDAKIVDAVPIRKRFLRLAFAGERLEADPTFRVRYSINRGSDGSLVAAGSDWSGQPTFGPSVDLWDPANIAETHFSAEVVVERPIGVEASRTTQTIQVLDPFDRSHPYVRWRKQHYYTGNKVPVIILSAIHRTALPGRCTFCDVRDGRFHTPYVYEPLDALPAPTEEGFSTRLCPYCFPQG